MSHKTKLQDCGPVSNTEGRLQRNLVANHCLQHLSCITASPPFACQITRQVLFDMALQMRLVLLAKKHLHSSHLEASRQ